MDSLWSVSVNEFTPEHLHHHETIFTIGNGFGCTRGGFEEGFPGAKGGTFVHGVFDSAPIVVTELANAPDWLPLFVLLDGERFRMDQGEVLSYEQSLDLRQGMLLRQVDWRSPGGKRAKITFERFASLANPHLFYMRCQVTPEFDGVVEFQAALKGDMDNEGLAHWQWLSQGQDEEALFLLNQTRHSAIQLASAMRFKAEQGELLAEETWDVINTPTRMARMRAVNGQPLVVEKVVAMETSRDTTLPVEAAVRDVRQAWDWQQAAQENAAAWEEEWDRTDVIIEGDDEAQISVRFNLFQMLIAAPRMDDRVNIGAKTLSGFGYRGHSFWDTEIFMLPLFIYTAPHIARNLLNYRYRNLAGARAKAKANGYEGAQYPWESADDGSEVTPTWVPHFADRNRLVRIWTGDIEIHISADVAYAAHKFWKATGDDQWLIDTGAEIILDTAKFWATRVEWKAEKGRYEINDVIGPDENHEHVNNNFMTNRMAQWNLQTGLWLLDWLKIKAPEKRKELVSQLDLNTERLAKWNDVIEKLALPADQTGLIEQFDGFFKLQSVDLEAMEPRSHSVQELLGIEEANMVQVIKQPDVLILFYLLQPEYALETVKINYDYYTPRTDHTFGSSLGPSIQAIMACEVGKPDEAYEHFIRAVRADLRDVRGNAGDGIHAASAAGTWQSVVFGFGGLKFSEDGWSVQARLPEHWKRLAFKFYYNGEMHSVDFKVDESDE